MLMFGLSGCSGYIYLDNSQYYSTHPYGYWNFYEPSRPVIIKEKIIMKHKKQQKKNIVKKSRG